MGQSPASIPPHHARSGREAEEAISNGGRPIFSKRSKTFFLAGGTRRGGRAVVPSYLTTA
jgi:hypothetical protein